MMEDDEDTLAEILKNFPFSWLPISSGPNLCFSCRSIVLSYNGSLELCVWGDHISNGRTGSKEDVTSAFRWHMLISHGVIYVHQKKASLKEYIR